MLRRKNKMNDFFFISLRKKAIKIFRFSDKNLNEKHDSPEHIKYKFIMTLEKKNLIRKLTYKHK